MKHTVGIGLAGLIVLCACPPALGNATYDVAVEATLFPDMNNGPGAWPDVFDGPPGAMPRNRVPVTNTFGWAQFSGAPDTLTDGGGNHDESALAGEVLPQPGFPLEGPHAACAVDRWANELGAGVSWSEACASVTRMKVNLGNLTGSGPPTPPGQDLWTDWNLTVDWSIDLFVDQPLIDWAVGWVVVDVYGCGQNYRFLEWWDTDLDGPVVNEGGQSVDSLSFMVPPNTVKPVFVDVYAYGYALDEHRPPPIPPPPEIPRIPPPPIPEPMTVLGVLLGLSGVGGYIRRRVKAHA